MKLGKKHLWKVFYRDWSFCFGPKECRMFEKIGRNKNGINYKLKID
jgi:hypothetical protein